MSIQKREQAGASLEIVINGFADWRTPFVDKKESLDSFWKIKLGKTEATFDEWVQAVAKINGQTLEETLLFEIMKHGFVLDELEIEFNHPEYKDWGLCVWLKEHSSYTCADHRLRKRHGPDISPDALRIISAVFSTENAGEQTVTLIPNSLFNAALSTSKKEKMLIAFRKDIIFHKAVFSQAERTESMAA